MRGALVPAVLAGQVTHQGCDVLPGLGVGPLAVETRPESLVQRGRVRHRTVILYDRSRLGNFLRPQHDDLEAAVFMISRVPRTPSPATIPKCGCRVRKGN